MGTSALTQPRGKGMECEGVPNGRVRVSLVRETPHSDALDCRTPEAAARILVPILRDLAGEAMVVIMLDTRRRLIGWDVPYRGTINRTAVEPRGFLVPALLTNASGIIVGHNHPSGDTSPSVEDLTFTRRLDDACKIMGIEFCDHLIIGDDDWTSMRERGGW